MTDLHFDNKKVVLTCIMNTFEVEAKIYIGKNINPHSNYKRDEYEYVYFPISLDRCLVLKHAWITWYNAPYQESEHSVFIQDIKLRSMKVDILSMDVYLDIKKGSEVTHSS